MKDIFEYIDHFKLVPLTDHYRLEDFNCITAEYKEFLVQHAISHQDMHVSKTHLLINKKNADIVAYMTLVTDSIKLNPSEKETHEMGGIPFPAFPAMKIGKLAVDAKYQERFKGIGSLMLTLARGFVTRIKDDGIGCNFITVDADLESSKTITDFYEKNAFVLNEKYKQTAKTVSMRLYVHDTPPQEMELEPTGTEG